MAMLHYGPRRIGNHGPVSPYNNRPMGRKPSRKYIVVDIELNQTLMLKLQYCSLFIRYYVIIKWKTNIDVDNNE